MRVISKDAGVCISLPSANAARMGNSVIMRKRSLRCDEVNRRNLPLTPKIFLNALDMLSSLFRLLSLPILLILFIFNLRRVVLTLAIFFAPRRRAASVTNQELPTVLILVPCRNEDPVLGGLGRALAQLDYPCEKMQVVLVDDGSRDNTLPIMQQIAGQYQNVHVLSMPESVGKARALNAALAECPFGEMIYIFDADHRPQPNAVRVTMEYFCDPSVAGVTGRTIPSNALASPSAYYTTVESFVNQMITMRAKDRLDLAPAMLGSNCAYRRSALEKCGGFPPGAFLEDSELTMRLCRAGYRLRFAEDAIAYQQVPQTASGYLRQHARWGRGFNDIARNHALALVRQKNVSPLLRAELLLFALGYFDRLALLGAGMLSGLSVLFPRVVRFPRPVLYLALATPFAQILALFAEQRVNASMWRRLPFVPLFFALDIFAALRATFDSVLNRARVWTTTERVRDDSP
jgi:1,2-diacylglycerol 3-beta-glucosyltransferase